MQTLLNSKLKSKFLELDKKAEKAMCKAVSKIVEEHKRTGTPLSVWKNGKVTRIEAKKIK